MASQNKIIVALVFLSVLLAGWLMATKKIVINQNQYISQEDGRQSNPKTALYSLKIGKTNLQAEVRKTESEQALGLSWRSSMGVDEGMVFVYQQPQRVLYWMKGMQFPLDFIWVKQGKVMELSENVPAPTKENPVVKTLVPQSEVDMVIEVNAGYVEKKGIKVGDEVVLGP